MRPGRILLCVLCGLDRFDHCNPHGEPVAGIRLRSAGLHAAAGLLDCLALVSLLATSQFGVAMVNWLASLLVPADSVPRMDFCDGIPVESRTLTVIPTMLTSAQNVKDLVEALEVRFLANRDENLHFGLLTDFLDADTETTPEDEPLLQLAKAKIEDLNQKYDKTKSETFFLFHRPRRWNAEECVWMGYERKRGKLGDLNLLLRGAGTDRFSLIVGQPAILSTVKYVITLDTDTELPRDSARELAGAMAHPLNRPRYDEARQRVTDGYGILQPRVAVRLPCTNRSRYARMFGNQPGIDPYTRVVSDVYQDVFGEGSFIGKGIYDVDAFTRSLQGRLPDNLILSHDLIEGCFARSGLLSDVPLYEEYPSTYGADVSRRRRWIRGDWQIAHWLLSRVPGPAGSSQRNPISLLSRWKIFDNLRRSVVAAALIMFFLLGWIVLPPLRSWTLYASRNHPDTHVVGVPFWMPFGSRRKFIYGSTFSPSARSTVQSFGQAAFLLACLPHEALTNLDAIVRASFRMLVTHKRLLQWNPSHAFRRSDRTDMAGQLRSMWIGPAIAIATAVYLTLAKP